MKCIDKLVKCKQNKRIGNHSLMFSADGHIELYYYHWTVICKVDHNRCQITIDDGGYKTSSTTRSINDYLRTDYIKNLIDVQKYKLIDKRN